MHAILTDTTWSSPAGEKNDDIFGLLPLCASMLPFIVRCLFKSSNENCGLLHKCLATSPQWTACNQLTINTPFHSLRRERALPYFVVGGRARTKTLVASQNWGHNMRAAQVFNNSPASDCTCKGLSGHDCIVPFLFFLTDTPCLRLWMNLATGSASIKMS